MVAPTLKPGPEGVLRLPDRFVAPQGEVISYEGTIVEALCIVCFILEHHFFSVSNQGCVAAPNAVLEDALNKGSPAAVEQN